VKASVIQEHPEFAGARFRILAINNVAYTTADLETLKDLESKSQLLVIRLNGKKVYQLPAEYFVEA